MNAINGELPLVFQAPWFRCFGCSPVNARGLRLAMRHSPDGRVHADVVFDEDLCSYPGVVHGGIVGTAADDVMAHAVLIGHRALTFSTLLRTRFVQVVRTGHEYQITARTAAVMDDVFSAEAELTSKTGDVNAVVTGTYKSIRDDNARSLFDLDGDEYEKIRPFLTGQDAESLGGER